VKNDYDLNCFNVLKLKNKLHNRIYQVQIAGFPTLGFVIVSPEAAIGYLGSTLGDMLANGITS
jgi:hypothetical protein